jgi:rhodanese-related sulfurtransferase
MTTVRTAALAAAALLAACNRPAEEPFKMVEVDDVQRLLGQPGVAVLDANNPDVFEERHLPGARLVTRANLADVLPADRGATLVFYCAGPR